jgi:hypothetical protein
MRGWGVVLEFGGTPIRDRADFGNRRVGKACDRSLTGVLSTVTAKPEPREGRAEYEPERGNAPTWYILSWSKLYKISDSSE